MTNGTILVRPGPAEIRLALFNPRNFTVRQTLTASDGSITAAQTGSGEIVVKIPAAVLDAEYSLTLAMQSPDGLRDFPLYTMRIRCVSFDTALLGFEVDGVPSDPDGYAFNVNVPYATETVTLAATTVAPNATLAIYRGTDDSGTPLAGGTQTAETTVSSLVPGDNSFYIKVTNPDIPPSPIPPMNPQGYAVTVYRGASPDKAITGFAFLIPVNETVIIDEAAHTVSVTVPYGTATGAMTAAVTHTGVSISPNPATAQNYTLPVIYTVTAADGTSQTYTVTVTEKPGAAITAEILDPIIADLTFGMSPVSISAGGTVIITLSKSVTVTDWYVEITGPESCTFTTNSFITATPQSPPPPPDPWPLGFYNVNVIATVGGVDYSGSFALIVE
jgi:hypothetical protein